MSAFSDALESEPSTNFSHICMVKAWRQQLSETDRNDFDAAASNANVQHSRLWRAMKNTEGNTYKGSLSTVQRHRTGNCMCEVKP